MKPLKVIFCGTPDFSVSSLRIIHQSPSIDLKLVVTMPDRPAGRGRKMTSSAVAKYARQHNLALLQTSNINSPEEGLLKFQESPPDLIILVSFAQFLRKKILQLPRLGCFNIHTSLLPRYRGAAPIQHAILNGDDTTGVSIQKIVQKMDAGDLCLQKEVAIPPTMTGGELFDLLKKQAAQCLEQFIDQALNDRLSFTPQDESSVSLAPALKKEDGLLRLGEKTSDEIYNQIRALDPWPGTYCFLNGQRLKVLKAKKVPTSLLPGKISLYQGTLLAGCKKGTLRLCQIQWEGKKAISDTDFINGLQNKSKKFKLSQVKLN